MESRKYIPAVLCAVMVLSGCVSDEQADLDTEKLLEPAALIAETVRVQKKDVVDADYETGYVVPTSYYLSFEIDGTVSYCEIQPGDQVKKYQELATLDEEALEAELLELDTAYDRLLQQYTLLNGQWDQETQEMQEQLAALSPDTEQAELLQLTLDERIYAHEKELEVQEQALLAITEQYDEKNRAATRNHLLSPCDGVVMDVEIRPGEEVSAGVCVIIIGDNNASYISCDTFYYEASINELVGLTGYLGDQSFPVEYMPYTEEELRANVSYDGVNLPSRFSIDMEQTGAQLGDFAAVELVNAIARDALCVRKDAIYSDEDGYYVYKDINGARQRVDVKTGVDNGMEVEILEGDLQEGDEVYVQE